MKKLAIVTSHPIQYNAPLFALLSRRRKIEIKVFYTWGEEALKKKYDPGFGKQIEWDIPLLEGYGYHFENNIAKVKGSHYFNGIINPYLNKNIEDWNADAVLVYGWSFRSHLNVLRYFHKKIPVFFRGDSTTIAKHSFIRKLMRKAFLKWIYSKVDKVFYVGTANKLYYVANGLKDNQLVFAPHSIDNTRFISADDDLTRQSLLMREKIGISKEDFVFLYAGKLDQNKNVSLLIKAFKNILVKEGNVKLVIAGDGSTKESLYDSARNSKSIIFLPFQNQKAMPVLYRVANVFVLPSLSETWGLSINEAMASGRPVLASDRCGAAQDLVIEGKTGYTFESGNTDDLQNRMLALLHNKSKLGDWGHKALQHVNEWSYEAVCKSIEAELI